MKLIAKIPCRFGGKQFFIGDEIPAEIVLDPKMQEKRGVLVCVDAQGQPHSADGMNQNINISVPTENGTIDLDVSPEGLNEVFAALMGTATKAEEIVSQMTNGDSLILLHMVDSRKAVKAAAEARAAAIAEAGEQ